MNKLCKILPIAVFCALPTVVWGNDSQSSNNKSQTPAQIENIDSKATEVQTDMSFGRIVRIKGNIATVQIISKIQPSQIEPKFLVCDIKLNPVAELESMHTGFKDCFLFKIIRGNAKIGDQVIVRYYKLKQTEQGDN